MIRELLGSPELSIREMAQAIHHLGLVVASLPSRHYPLLQITVILLCIRSVDRTLYGRFIRGEASDLDVVHGLFSHPGLSKLNNTHKGAYIEAYIIRAYMDILRRDDSSPVSSTPLMTKYLSMQDPQHTGNPEEVEHAKEVIERVHGISIPDGRVYADVVVSRIEMFAKSIAHRLNDI